MLTRILLVVFLTVAPKAFADPSHWVVEVDDKGYVYQRNCGVADPKLVNPTPGHKVEIIPYHPTQEVRGTDQQRDKHRRLVRKAFLNLIPIERLNNGKIEPLSDEELSKKIEKP
jgi:hypothetical protein